MLMDVDGVSEVAQDSRAIMRRECGRDPDITLAAIKLRA